MNRIQLFPAHLWFAIIIATCSIIAGWLYASFSSASRDLTVPDQKALRRNVNEITLTAIIIFIIGWKLSPVLFSFRSILASPAGILYLPGGLSGSLLGLTAALVYIILKSRKYLNDYKTNRNPFSKQMIRSLGLTSITAISILLAGFIFTGSNNYLARLSDKQQFDPAPAFSLQDHNGNNFSLADTQGKPVVIAFWTTWCPACRTLPGEMKILQERSDAKIIGINLTDSERNMTTVSNYIRERAIDYRVLLDNNGAVQKKYSVSRIPTTVVLDAAGNIIYRREGPVSAAILQRILRRLD